MDATYVASVFEFSDHDCENACTPPVQPTVIGSSQPVGSSGHDSNQTLTSIMAVPFCGWVVFKFPTMYIYVSKQRQMTSLYTSSRGRPGL